MKDNQKNGKKDRSNRGLVVEGKELRTDKARNNSFMKQYKEISSLKRGRKEAKWLKGP